MKHNELLKELEKRMSRYGYCDTWTHIELFIKEYEALTKDEKPIRLKDVIKRIKGFDDETKLKWTYDILKGLGSDFASKMFHEGYQQGKFEGSWVGNQLKDADKIRQELNKPVVKQFVADWYEENKDVFEANLYRCAYNTPSFFDGAKLNEFERWFLTAGTKPFQTLVNMHQFGYEVEKEKRYLVKVKGVNDFGCYLNKGLLSKEYFWESKAEIGGCRTKHTRKELEEAGFGWVFDCPGIEIEEVE
jgi:hypothetical protein